MTITPPGSTTITIAGVAFTGLQLPYKRSAIPLPKPKGMMKPYFMSEGEDGPGVRRWDLLGAHVSYQDYKLTVQKVASSDVSTIETAFYNQWTNRTANELTIAQTGVSTDVYNFLFAEDGFDPSLHLGAQIGDDAYIIKFKLHILEKTA